MYPCTPYISFIRLFFFLYCLAFSSETMLPCSSLMACNHSLATILQGISELSNRPQVCTAVCFLLFRSWIHEHSLAQHFVNLPGIPRCYFGPSYTPPPPFLWTIAGCSALLEAPPPPRGGVWRTSSTTPTRDKKRTQDARRVTISLTWDMASAGRVCMCVWVLATACLPACVYMLVCVCVVWVDWGRRWVALGCFMAQVAAERACWVVANAVRCVVNC